MAEIFPEPVRKLPQAHIPLKGMSAYLSQSKNHQIIFMEFSEDVEVPEHSHADQWGIVLESKIDLTINGIERTYEKGERFFFPKRSEPFGQNTYRLCRHNLFQ